MQVPASSFQDQSHQVEAAFDELLKSLDAVGSPDIVASDGDQQSWPPLVLPAYKFR
jgi:hypothetical protein